MALGADRQTLHLKVNDKGGFEMPKMGTTGPWNLHFSSHLIRVRLLDGIHKIAVEFVCPCFSPNPGQYTEQAFTS